MPSITIRRDGKPAKEVELEKGLTLIGQKADADIKIEDPDQIAERASILRLGDNFILNELDPASGLLVNGQPVRKHVLKDRDLITIGEYRMTFQDKREADKPIGIEMEAADIQAEVEARHPGSAADPFHAAPGKKSELVIYVVLGAIVLGIFFAGYRSYVEKQAADEQTELANKAYQEAKRKEAERPQGNASIVDSSIKDAGAPAVDVPVAAPGN